MQNSSNPLLAFAAFVIAVAGIKAAQTIVSPFLLAVFIAAISAPFLVWLQGHGFPKVLAFLIVTFLIIGVLTGLGVIIGNSLDGFLGTLPELQAKLSDLTNKTLQWFQEFGIPINKSAIPEGLDPANALSTAGVFLKSTTKILSNSFLIFLMVTFMLFETVSLRAKLAVLSKEKPKNLEAVELFLTNLKRYLAIKSSSSFATGVIIGVLLTFLGVPYAPLWGVFAFLLNYIPTIGSILAAIPAILVSLVEGDINLAIWVVVIFASTNIIIGNFIEPRYMGKGLGLSTLVVFLSLLFWGWVLGTVGMFLAIPLTMSVKIALDVSPKTKWIALLLSDFKNGNEK